jgi:hypothetical protein
MLSRIWIFLISIFLYSLLLMIFSDYAIFNTVRQGLNNSMVPAAFNDVLLHKKDVFLLGQGEHDSLPSEKAVVVLDAGSTLSQRNMNISLNQSSRFVNKSLSESASSDAAPVHTGSNFTTVLRRANEVFYFAITHHSTINSRLDASLRTWCSRVLALTGNKVIWYSNKPDPRVDHVVSYDDHDAYGNITWRMMAIWKHVARNYPDFSWYARFWDDNIVFPETFQQLLVGENSEEPIEIGRLAKYPSGQLVKPGGETAASLESKLYIDGGAGSLMSRAAFHLLTSNIEQCKGWLQENEAEYSCAFACEDVLFGACLSRLLGIRFKRGLGMYHTTPPALQVTDQEIIQHAVVDGEHSGDWSMLRTMHYADHNAMERIDKLWYS